MWKPPYNPIGVTVLLYNITVFHNDTLIQESHTQNLTWTFCPFHAANELFGEYELFVTPTNSLSIIGETDSTIGSLAQLQGTDNRNI